MEVPQKRKSYIENSPNGDGPAVFKRSKNEEPIINRTQGGGDNVVVDDGYLDSFPPGYRFCPLNVELIQCYLKKKIMGSPLPRNRITEVNLYSYNPERLVELYKQYGENEWYFFTPREKKYPNGTRPNRSAGDGYWKATGADRAIKCDDSVVGYRKALVFYKGKAPKGDKTSWIMHEYRVRDPPPPKQDKGYNEMRLDDFVLCKIHKKSENNSVKIKSKNEDPSSSIQNEDPSPSIQNEDPSPSIQNEDPSPSIQNDGTNEILTFDEQHMMYNPLIEELVTKIFFEEQFLSSYSLSIQNEDPSPSIQNDGTNEILASDEQHMMHYPLIGELVPQIFPEKQFPSSYFPDGIVSDEVGNSLEDFVDYSSVDLYLLPDDLKVESQESRNEGFEHEGFMKDLSKKNL